MCGRAGNPPEFRFRKKIVELDLQFVHLGFHCHCPGFGKFCLAQGSSLDLIPAQTQIFPVECQCLFCYIQHHFCPVQLSVCLAYFYRDALIYPFKVFFSLRELCHSLTDNAPAFTSVEHIPGQLDAVRTNVVRDKGHSVLVGMAGKKSDVGDIFIASGGHGLVGLYHSLLCRLQFRISGKCVFKILIASLRRRDRDIHLGQIQSGIQRECQQVTQFGSQV